MERSTDFVAISLLAAASVAVGLTGARYMYGLAGSPPGESGNLVRSIAGILGLDQDQVGDYLRGDRSEIGYGPAALSPD